MLKAPKFWYYNQDSFLSNALYPLSLVFRLGTRIRNLVSKERKANLPIICVGNIVIGGAGKTPVALKIGNMLKKAGYNPHFVSKGYGGLEKNNTLVKDWHSPKSVGDEPLLLSEIAPTWIGLDRNRSFRLAKEQGANCIVMDDGFQNPTLQKDFSIVVINGEQGFGNKRVIPAGPLRENISNLKKYKNIVLNGNLENIYKIKRDLNKISTNFNIHIGKYIPLNKNKFDLNKKYLAFSGIGNHETFISMLKENKFNIIKDIEFPDHYNYLQSDLNRILSLSNKMNCKIITTEKDIKRIKNKNKINFIKTELKIEDEEKMIEAIFENNE